MKKMLLATAALAVVIASPAFAQSYDPEIGSGNVVGTPAPTYGQSAPQGASRESPYSAYAQSPARASGRRAPAAVHEERRSSRGSDPDANIRLQLQKDHDGIQ